MLLVSYISRLSGENGTDSPGGTLCFGGGIKTSIIYKDITLKLTVFKVLQGSSRRSTHFRGRKNLLGPIFIHLFMNK